MLTRRQERKLLFLMRKLDPRRKSYFDLDPNFNPNGKRKDYYEAFYLSELKGQKEEDLFKEWQKIKIQQWHRAQEYTRRPAKVRQDNKGIRVGSGGSNRTTIRFPKNCRKTAWKRFWKLFPALDGCKSWDDYNKIDPEKRKPMYYQHSWDEHKKL